MHDFGMSYKILQDLVKILLKIFCWVIASMNSLMAKCCGNIIVTVDPCISEVDGTKIETFRYACEIRKTTKLLTTCM